MISSTLKIHYKSVNCKTEIQKSVSETLTGERLPIMRKAVRVESNRKAILLVGAAGILRLLTLAVSRG